MAFQFKRDKSQNLELILAGDIDLEVTPDIKTQVVSQLEDANSLNINGKSISYLDSSGVSILIICMQTCKQRQLGFSISEISEEAHRVLQLAKLDKILPIAKMSGPAQLVDVDAFSGVSGADDALASEISSTSSADAATDVAQPAMPSSESDDDLIAALSKPAPSKQSEEAPMPQEEVSIEMTPEPMDDAAAQPAQAPSPEPAPAAEPQAPASPAAPAGGDDTSGGNSGGGFTPGTFG